MKKLFLCASALLFTGAMMAQTLTLPSQSSLTDVKGDNSLDANEVSHLGTNPAVFGGNTGEAIQNGNSNKVQVRQAGTNNSSYSEQSDGLGTGDNRAKIWQTGAAYFDSGFRNVADVRQKGTGNQGYAKQEGDTNEAVIRQGMKEATLGVSTGNRALINHGVAENGETNYAMTEQDGTTNTSRTIQLFDNSEARTVQEGTDNMADIRQKADPNQSNGHSALLEQYGERNASRIRQEGSARNTAHSVQIGDDNKVNQNQKSDAISGVGNSAIADQGYGGIPLSVDIGSIWGDLNAVDNVSNGAFNGASDNGKVLQNQDGDGNEAYAGQYGDGSAVGNIAEQNQVGNDNNALSVQNAYGNSNGGDNYGRQDQLGDRNNAGIAQNGTDHKAYQRQLGNDNDIYSTQRGSQNKVSTYQGGNGNIGETGQRGQNNTILLVQKQEAGFGGHSFKVSQNLPGGLPVGMPNGGNIADVLQLGPNGDFATDGENCDFQAPTDLTMPGGVPSFDIGDPCAGGGC
ncbi:MAG: curlin [Bizionia sp.]|nr:curlin [Bizionia sp.]